MKRLFHYTMITTGIVAVLISFSGLLSEPTEESEESESQDLSLEEVDEIVTVAKHEYQLEKQTHTMVSPPEFSSVKTIHSHADHAGHIFWEDPKGVEYESDFTVENGSVHFSNADLIRNVDRSRFVGMIMGQLGKEEPE